MRVDPDGVKFVCLAHTFLMDYAHRMRSRFGSAVDVSRLGRRSSDGTLMLPML